MKLSSIEIFFDDGGEVGEELVGLAGVGGTVHDGEGLWFQVGEFAEDAFGLASVRHVAGEWACLESFHGLVRRFDQVGGGERLHVAEMMEEVGAEQSLAGFFEEDAGVPTVRDVRGLMEAI